MKGTMSGMGVGITLLLLTPLPSFAQEANPVIFGIYYRCDQSREARADEITQQVVAPVIQKHVDAGHLTGWLWLAHEQGGAWRRISAMLGTDLNVMMDVRQEVVDELQNEHGAATTELTSICSSHDDYIWTGVSVSDLDPDAVGPATLSAYHACDRSREARADEIFEEVLAPLYQKHLEMGHLASWGFYAHRVGGIFRRLETFSGADHKTLLEMQNAVYQEAGETAPLAMQEFNEICSWHTDYMWTNTVQQ